MRDRWSEWSDKIYINMCTYMEYTFMQIWKSISYVYSLKYFTKVLKTTFYQYFVSWSNDEEPFWMIYCFYAFLREQPKNNIKSDQTNGGNYFCNFEIIMHQLCFNMSYQNIRISEICVLKSGCLKMAVTAVMGSSQIACV